MADHGQRNMAWRVRMLRQSQFHLTALHDTAVLAESLEGFRREVGSLQQRESKIFAQRWVAGDELKDVRVGAADGVFEGDRGFSGHAGLSPLQGLRLLWTVYPRLTPWAVLLRRSAAGWFPL